ncbi:hypothetical protein PDJAM_G00095440 [Pangasius djambal]|uniref:Uncharacterized protein n=1 Tax=Pangasius djambal TaxID=1691987 RepID=A0ACC5Z645_9TELE|nr:hypothetical protein [Pangasius djambal]
MIMRHVTKHTSYETGSMNDSEFSVHRWPLQSPGPWPLPFVGNIFTELNFKTIDKLAEKYGGVFSLRWGSEKTVFISGHKMVKEALITQLDSFADRPVVPLFHNVFKGLGK